jgi:hypothetical protein
MMLDCGAWSSGMAIIMVAARCGAACAIFRPKESAMIAYDDQQRIDTLAEQLANLRGYL